MSLAITPTGITIDTLSELIERLSTEYRNIYGQDIAIDQDTADGQRIGIESKLILDVQTALLYLYTSLDVDQAKGEALNRAIKYAGIVRRQATNSTWDLTVTADRFLTIPSGYTIKDESGQEWQTVTDYDLFVGANSVSFESVNLGAVVGLIGSTFEQVTVYLGITGIAASVSAVVGIDEETDEELRLRRNRSLQNPSYSTIGSMTGKLFNVNNVIDVMVYENSSDVYDALLDLNAHSIWCVVEGGDVAAIAEVIAKQKTAGTGLKGDITGTYLETLDNGRVITHLMKFDRPDYIDVYVKVDATRTTSSPVDTALLAANLAKASFKIGDPVDAFALYEVATVDFKGAYLSNLQISDDDITYTNGRLDAVNGAKYRVLAENVTVTEIIP